MKEKKTKSPPKFIEALKTNKNLQQTVIVLTIMAAVLVVLFVIGAANSNDKESDELSTQFEETTEAETTEPEITEPETEGSTEEVTTETPETNPPETAPPETDPPVTESPTTQPPETNLPATQPPVTSPPETDPPLTQPPQNSEEQRTVYYTKNGECYHYENPCGRGTYYPISLDKAKQRGLRPCEKCVLH